MRAIDVVVVAGGDDDSVVGDDGEGAAGDGRDQDVERGVS